MEHYPDAEKGALNLLRNRLGRDGVESAHTPPASHYPHIYLWDSCFAAIINARAGGERWLKAAQTELKALVAGQRSDGFIPNMQRVNNDRSLDPEWLLAFDKSAEGSNYSQPPVLALAVSETYNALLEVDPSEAYSFLSEMYQPLVKFYKYWERDRSNSSDDKLIGVIHPHETGRDSGPEFDFIKPWRLERNGPETSLRVNKANIAIDYLSILSLGRKLRSAEGDTAKAREIFWVNDVMMNCMYVDNLYEMAELARAVGNVPHALQFSKLASTVEHQIMAKMWDGERKVFQALNKDGSPIEEITISNLFPLALPNLREEQLEAVLDLMDSSFNEPYPLPTVATNSLNYDPHNRESDRLWRGPTWINTNWYLVERGLKTQLRRLDLSHRPDLKARCAIWEQKIVESSKNLLDMPKNLGTHGPYEHYDPITAEGQRRRVRSFAWSNLGYVMLKSIWPI